MNSRSHASAECTERERISLSETLDRVLNKGVVVCGEVVISVADIDLVYLGVQLLLTSVDKAASTVSDGSPRSPNTTGSHR